MTNEQILADFIQRVWNEKNKALIPVYVSPAYCVFIDNGDPWEGKTLDHQEFATRLDFSFQSFSDIHFEIITSIADGDYVAITWIMTGTNDGKIGNFPPTHKTINTKGTTLYHFLDGKLCGHTQVFDRTTVMKQLGFIP